AHGRSLRCRVPPRWWRDGRHWRRNRGRAGRLAVAGGRWLARRRHRVRCRRRCPAVAAAGADGRRRCRGIAACGGCRPARRAGVRARRGAPPGAGRARLPARQRRPDPRRTARPARTVKARAAGFCMLHGSRAEQEGAVKFRYLVLAGTLAAFPVAAEDVQFEGHVLEVDASQEARVIVRMAGTRYRLPGTAAQIVDKAEKCVTGQKGLALVSTDAAGGTLAASGRADYRQRWSTRSIRANLRIEAS